MDIEKFKYLDKDASIVLSIEIGCKLLFEIEDVNFSVNSTFIGFRQDHYVLTTFPTNFPQIKHKIFPGSHLIVKYLHEGVVYVFPTKINQILAKNLQMLVMVYPKFIQQHEIRSLNRADCCIPFTVTINSINRGGIIRDINKNGCCCVLRNIKVKSTFVHKEKLIELICQFPGIEGDVLIHGKIKNTHRESTQVNLGIQFIELDPLIKQIIQSYLRNIKEES